MEFLLSLISNIPFVGGILKDFIGPILGGIGAMILAFLAYSKGKKDQAQKGKIAVQKETIDAEQTRNTIEDRVANASPDERKRLRDKWTRD